MKEIVGQKIKILSHSGNYFFNFNFSHFGPKVWGMKTEISLKNR
jgi:hypothetical protein